jgi:hypothetical protein
MNAASITPSLECANLLALWYLTSHYQSADSRRTPRTIFATIQPEMIAHLSGTLLSKEPNQVVVDVSGVGYEVNIRSRPSTTSTMKNPSFNCSFTRT